MIASVGAALGRIDPNVTLTLASLATYMAPHVVRERMLAILSAFFGGLALLLSALGVFGLVAYYVNRTRSELGLRLAVGASPARVRRMVLLYRVEPRAIPGSSWVQRWDSS